MSHSVDAQTGCGDYRAWLECEAEDEERMERFGERWVCLPDRDSQVQTSERVGLMPHVCCGEGMTDRGRCSKCELWQCPIFSEAINILESEGKFTYEWEPGNSSCED